MKRGCALKVHKCRIENHKNNMSKIFTLNHLILFEIDARKTCEKFVYKH